MTKEKEVSKEQYPEMANEEYRVEINKICEGIESNRLLGDFYISALQKAKSEQSIDYQVSVPDCADMVIEMVNKKKELIGVINSIECSSLLEYLIKYTKRLKEKW